LLSVRCILKYKEGIETTAEFSAKSDSELTDSRDNKTYKIVKIGEQTWMAENLNYDANRSLCYDAKPANCSKYGMLYEWETAKKVCPSGWHLPSKAEWEKLADSVGKREEEARKLKAKSGWAENSNGEDAYGFAALPGGNGGLDHEGFDLYFNAGYHGYWWSSSSDPDSHHPYNSFISYDAKSLSFAEVLESNWFSVRCARD
jgi:uncharacterized protein (TIGR02145 family)